MMIVLVACAVKDDGEGEGEGEGGGTPTDLTFIEAATGTHTVAGVDYTVDATSGNISIANVETYLYVSADVSETRATYSPKDNLAEFLGARIRPKGDTTIFSVYLKDRVDFWTLATDVMFTDINELGGSINNAFVKNNDTVTVTTDNVNPAPTVYNVDKNHGHLTTAAAPDTIVYHYMGYNSDTEAYFRNEDNKFLGIAVVDGVSKTYINKRTAPWTTKDEVKFAIEHEVGGDPLTLGVIWKKVGNMPGGKEAFAALSFGDNIWLVGNDANVHKSDNQGDSWTSISTTGFESADLNVPTTGVALAADNLLVANSKNVYKSSDGGENWSSVYTIPTPSSDGFKAIHVTDSDNPTEVPNGIYFIGKTTVVYGDATGNNWEEKTMTQAYGNKQVFGMGVAVHQSTFYIIGGWSDSGMYKSTDGGITWDSFASNFPSGRDRVAVVSAPDFIYHIGWTGASDVWKASVTDLSTWTRVVEHAGYDKKDTAAALYIPANAGNNTKERLLIMGGRHSPNTVWRAEVED